MELELSRREFLQSAGPLLWTSPILLAYLFVGPDGLGAGRNPVQEASLFLSCGSNRC